MGDSSVMAFEIAGRAATRQGLREGGPRLMEPIMKVDVICPEEFMGTVVGDISSRRGIMSEMGDRGNMKTVTATIPLSQMFQYVSDLRSMTKGRAQYSMTFDKYDFVPGDIEKEICKKFQPAGEEMTTMPRTAKATSSACPLWCCLSALSQVEAFSLCLRVLVSEFLLRPLLTKRPSLKQITDSETWLRHEPSGADVSVTLRLFLMAEVHVNACTENPSVQYFSTFLCRR